MHHSGQMTGGLRHALALVAALNFAIPTSFAADPNPAPRKIVSTRAPASQTITFDTATLPPADQVELFAATTFLRYLQSPIARTTASVANHLGAFIPAPLVNDLRDLSKNTVHMPAFELQGDPLKKIVFRDRLTVNAVEVGEAGSDVYLRVRGKVITHQEMMTNPQVARALFDATRDPKRTSAARSLWPLPPGFSLASLESAHASWGWGIGLGVGLVAIGLGLWFGLKALSKPKVTVTGIPTNFNVNVPTNYRVDVPSTYTINTNSNINAQAGINGTQNFNFTAGTTRSLANTIASVTQARITDAVQRVAPGATPATGSR